MVDLADIQLAYYMMAATGVLIAAIYYIFNMRQSIVNRKAQLFTQMTSITQQKDWLKDSIELLTLQWNDFDDFARKYDSGVNPDNFAKRSQHMSVLNSLGYYVRRGQLEIEQVDTLMGGVYYPTWLWAKYGDVIKRYREILNIPDYLANFEFLAAELDKLQRKRGRQMSVVESGGSYSSPSR